MADYKKITGSKIQFTLTVTEEEFKSSQKSVLEQLKKTVSLKGFRKGHAPDSAVIGSVGPTRLLTDTFESVLGKYYGAFITKHKISPVNQPSLDFDPKGKFPMEVKGEVEVFPEIELKDYKKIKIKPVKIDIKPAEITDVIETIMADMKLAKEVDRAAKDKDLVTVSFVGKDKAGNELPNTKGENTEFRLGLGHFLPDLEKAIKGMKTGDSKKKIAVKFPKTYHAKDMAGTTVWFEVQMHLVKEIDPNSLTKKDIETITGKAKSESEFKEDIKKLIESNKGKTARQGSVDEYKRKLIAKTKVELPVSWLDREVSERLQNIKQSPEYQAQPDKFWDRIGKTEDQMKKDLYAQSEEGLKSFLALTEIIKQEGIELDKDEYETVHTRVHQRIAQNPALTSQHDQLMQNESLNAKIDKFFNTLLS